MLSSDFKNQEKLSKSRTSSFLIKLGFTLIGLSLALFILIFYPVIFEELKYQTQTPYKNTNNVIKPLGEDFGIVVPKIGANAKIIANVNPFDPKDYQWQLTKGVAHARGTAFPGQPGNVFLFSHSSVNFYEANRYNSIFYLLSKMKKGDEIYLYYKKNKYKYKVTEKKIVDASQIQYLRGQGSKKTATLMTCWPAGTTLKRLLIIGEIVSF